MDHDDLKESIEHLTQKVEELIHRWAPWRHLVNGVMSGIGAAIGATLVLAIIAWTLHSLARVDILKPAVDSLLPYLDQAQKIPTVQYVDEVASPSPSPTVDLSPTPDVAS